MRGKLSDSEQSEEEHGGHKRWIVFALLTMATFSTYLMRVSYSVTFVPMAKEFSWSLEREGVLLSSFYWTYSVGNWVAIFTKRVNPKTLIWVSVGMSLGTFVLVPPLVGLLPNGAMILVLRLVCGVVEGVTFPAVAQMIQLWTNTSEKSFVTSVVYAGPNLASIFSLSVSPLIIGDQNHWRYVFFGYGMFVGAWLVAFWALATRDPHDFGRGRLSPAWLQLGKTELASRPALPRTVGSVVAIVPWSRVVKSRAIWALFYVHGCSNFTFYIFLSWLPTYLTHAHNFSLHGAGFASALPFVCNVGASLMFGRLADHLLTVRLWPKTQTRKMFQSIGLLVPGFSLLFIGMLEPSAVVTVGFICLALFAQGAFMSGFMGGYFDIAGANTGAVFALGNGLAQLPGIVSVATAGPLVNAFGWMGVFVVAFLVSLSGAVVFVWGFDSTNIFEDGTGKEMLIASSSTENLIPEDPMIPIETVPMIPLDEEIQR